MSLGMPVAMASSVDFLMRPWRISKKKLMSQLS
jgi:hypothetical protein